MNTKIWIKKAKKVHGNKYDYSKSKYVDSKTKIKIICPTHGEFEQNNYSHLKGYGCKKCQYDKYKIKIEDFIIRSNRIHNNKYSYQSRIKSNKMIIICPIHGEFKQSIYAHLEGKGCQKCAHKFMKLTLEQFLNRANKKHNNKYKYVVKNFNNKGKIKIICPQHGQFEQSVGNHLKGYGCKKCKYDSFKYSINEFVQKAKKVHGNKYDYSKSKYVDSKTKIKIICSIHGEFEQMPPEHLRGHGCKKCSIDKNRLSINEFITRSLIVHGNKYLYDLVKFKSNSNYYNDVIIVCPEHGRFKQSISNHLHGHGCPSCPTMISSGHNEIMLFIDDIGEKIIVNDRQIISPYELDIYLPNKNIAIEYNGGYWHSYNKLESKNDIYYHYDKYELCKNNGIRLIQINEYDWNDDKLKAIIKSKIKNLLNMSNRIYARNCTISITNEKDFMNKNHMQGHRNSTIAYGLFYNNKLMSCMSFNKYKNESWEIIRFANELNYTIVGGASKLFKRFQLEQKPSKILTYADRRYSNGNLYKKLKFDLINTTKPGYCYIKNHKMFSRQQFQKHKLKNKLEIFNPDLTEAENMFNNGYRRLWDAGHYKFIKNKLEGGILCLKKNR